MITNENNRGTLICASKENKQMKNEINIKEVGYDLMTDLLSVNKRIKDLKVTFEKNLKHDTIKYGDDSCKRTYNGLFLTPTKAKNQMETNIYDFDYAWSTFNITYMEYVGMVYQIVKTLDRLDVDTSTIIDYNELYQSRFEFRKDMIHCRFAIIQEIFVNDANGKKESPDWKKIHNKRECE